MSNKKYYWLKLQRDFFNMNDIIKIKNKECFIDSEGLSVLAKTEPRMINQLIKKYADDLTEFGGLSFEMINPSEKGGRPKKIYSLNEQQATLLTTFMKNRSIIVEFKKKLVKEFFKMRSYVQKQETIRLSGIETRKTLTDKIQESGENDRMHGHGYSTYTNMIYELTGLRGELKQFKLDQKIITGYDKLKFRDTLNPEKLKQVELAESLIKPLIEMVKQYSEIKEVLKPLFETKELT